jgi:hypothetical protein
MSLRSLRRRDHAVGARDLRALIVVGGTDPNALTDPYFNGNLTVRSRNANETNPLDDDNNIKPHENRSTRPPKIPTSKVISIQSVEKRHAAMESLSSRWCLFSSGQEGIF